MIRPVYLVLAPATICVSYCVPLSSTSTGTLSVPAGILPWIAHVGGMKLFETFWDLCCVDLLLGVKIEAPKCFEQPPCRWLSRFVFLGSRHSGACFVRHRTDKASGAPQDAEFGFAGSSQP